MNFRKCVEMNTGKNEIVKFTILQVKVSKDFYKECGRFKFGIGWIM